MIPMLSCMTLRSVRVKIRKVLTIYSLMYVFSIIQIFGELGIVNVNACNSESIVFSLGRKIESSNRFLITIYNNYINLLYEFILYRVTHIISQLSYL